MVRGNSKAINWRDAGGNSMLHLAARSGNVSRLRDLLARKQYVDINLKNNRNSTPLLCANYAEPEIVRLLLKHGASVHCKDRGNRSPLYLAVEAKSVKLLLLLLDAGAKQTYKGRSELYLAVKRGNLEIVNVLLDSAELDVGADEHCASLLTLAASLHNEPMMELLFERRVNASAVDEKGNSTLHYAVQIENTSFARRLIERGADVNQINRAGQSPLFFAVGGGYLSQVKLLAENGANVSVHDSEGNSLLHVKRNKKSQNILQVIKYLLEIGLDLEARNVYGFTPLLFALRNSYAAGYCDYEQIRLYLELGADFRVKNNKGKTVVHYAASHGPKLLALMLDWASLLVNERNDTGSTALHYAAWAGSTKSCLLLLGCGADINMDDNKGFSPLFHAVQDEEEAVVQLMVNRGASVSQDIVHAARQCYNREITWILVRQAAKIERLEWVFSCKERQYVWSGMSRNVEVYAKACEREVNKMRKNKVFEDISLLDILNGSRTLLAGYARNEELVSAFKKKVNKDKFPKYYTSLAERFGKEIEKNRLLMRAASSLGEILPLNPDVDLKILSFLEEDDWKYLEIN